MAENAKEIVRKSTPLVTKFVRISFDCSATDIHHKNWIQTTPLYYTIPIGFVLILLLRRCCGGGGGGRGGNGKTMKAPGRNNVRIPRRSFESGLIFSAISVPKRTNFGIIFGIGGI
ncbi:hypothetical protein HAX54_024623 [Datura stramonium]|uniref:Transmembrane protein n=1 Tax=Datura stramonium TaxID=4076 RepID=A0ABS8RG89_DATST|nr:hypothetical protein [Datura stramonium]